jgi:hypothetical protein
VRRDGPDGVAEWDGDFVAPAALAGAGLDWLEGAAAAPPREPHEAVVALRLAPDAVVGHLWQRRRSPHLAVRLSPIRLTPLPVEEPDAPPPVARLADVSAHGAGVIVDCPLAAGTDVALEFELPGEPEPFAVRGRVVEPGTPLHGEMQPQPDGLPGFRRGVEFLGSPTTPEGRRLAAALSGLLRRRGVRGRGSGVRGRDR